MENMIKLNYFYGDEPDRLCLYRIPKILFTKEYFSGLSTDAKVLYGLMLDHMSMSRENRWRDEEDRVYIFYSIQRACAYLGCKKDKAMKLFAELDSETGIGLIERVKRGQGKSDLIYVMNFDLPKEAEDRTEIKKLREKNARYHNDMINDHDLRNVDNYSDEVVGKIDQSEKPTTSEGEKVVEKTDRSEKPTSRSLENRSPGVGKTDPNNTIQNNNKYSDTCPVQSCHNTGGDDEEDDWLDHIDCSKPIRITGYYPKMDRQDEIQPDKAAYIDYLRDCIGYEDMIREERYRYEKEKIDGIINMIADVATTTPPDGKEWVNSKPYSHEVVKRKLAMYDERLMIELIKGFAKEKILRSLSMMRLI